MKDRNTSKHLCLCFGLLPMLNIYQFIFYNFLRLRFQRVHQPHPAHGVTAFNSSVTPAASIIRGSIAPSVPAPPVNLQQVWVQLFAQNQAAVKAGPVFLQVALPHTAIQSYVPSRLRGWVSSFFEEVNRPGNRSPAHQNTQ